MANTNFKLLWNFRIMNFTNLTKVRPLFTLSHKGSDNSRLLIVFKWTLYEHCICLLHHDFYHSDSVFLAQCSIFEDDESRLAYFQSQKSNDWLVNVISTKFGSCQILYAIALIEFWLRIKFIIPKTPKQGTPFQKKYIANWAIVSITAV